MSTGARNPDPPADLPPEPLLSGVVVCWRGEDELAELVAVWPDDRRFELVAVDNGGREVDTGGEPVHGSAGARGVAAAGEPAARAGARSNGGLAERLVARSSLPEALRVLEPGANLGFAGGVAAGMAAARAPAVLLLNPDAVPEPGALEALLDGLAAHPEAAGLAPRLIGAGGESQHRWQLRRLPGVATLLAQALLLPAGAGPRAEPAEGAPVEQPAAAALLLRRSALEAVGGLDEAFYPAWFEDVDLARRLAAAGERIVYWPRAVFRHGLGSSVPRLGYGRFLWVYYRNLVRYLRKHHGTSAAASARLLLAPAALARSALLPLRRPRRARSRWEAARGLVALALGALSGWREPAAWAAQFRRPVRTPQGRSADGAGSHSAPPAGPTPPLAGPSSRRPAR